ncbi:MAG: serine hydrolase domain-containing protein, partial [Prosthecobacter sp.]
MRPIQLALAWLSLSSVLLAQKPITLADSAQHIAKGVPRGCIVTGEWRDGKAVYAISGPDKPANVPVEKVVFEIGSISKVFTGLLLAQVVLEKKVTFETTLKQALDAQQAFADDKVAAITLAQLATHTSGLPRMPDNADFTVADPYGTYDTKKLGEWLASVKLDKAVPHEMSYSNVGVAILGHVIERALGDSWANLVRDRITQPLGMHDTMPEPTTEERQRLAPPFDGKKEAHEWTFQAFAPAGGLRSTAADMMLFGHALTHPETSSLREAI